MKDFEKKKIGNFLETHPHLEYFCTFIGYPKSGHSLVGSLLDAHPNIIIAHELHVLKCIKLGFNREAIYSLLLQNSQYYSKRDRTWSGYSYLVPRQWNGRYKNLVVIGDKKGGGTTDLLHQYPGLLDKLIDTIPLKHKFIHVARNPFDSITTLSIAIKEDLKSLIGLFSQMWEVVSSLKKKIPPDDLFEINHEEFISNPGKWLLKLCRFLGQEIPPGYLDDCTAIINPIPHKSRFKITWPGEDIRAVEKKIKRYPFLQGYAYDS